MKLGSKVIGSSPMLLMPFIALLVILICVKNIFLGDNDALNGARKVGSMVRRLKKCCGSILELIGGVSISCIANWSYLA